MYCVLWGSLLLDYDNEEDAKASMTPKTAIELLGVSEWDGKGRANNYPFSFLLVTHTGSSEIHLFFVPYLLLSRF